MTTRPVDRPVRHAWRVVWTIAAKDIGDAIRNKSILVNLISVLVAVFIWRMTPAWFGRGTTNIIVWDQGASRLTAAIDQDGRYRLIEADAQERFLQLVGDEQQPILGVILPADLDHRLASGESVSLTGHLPWAARKQMANVQADYEALFSQMLGQPVEITLDGNLVYPQPGGMGEHTMMTVAQLVPVMLVSLSAVPLLMIEEKQARTMDTLLVSPAGPWQVAAGKALAGLFYGLLFVEIALVMVRNSIVHWGIAISGSLIGLVVFVLLGLLVGSLVDRPQQMSIWMMPLMTFLLIPIILNAVEVILPAALAQALTWLPSVALAILIRASYVGTVETGPILRNLAIVLAWSIPVVMLLVRRLSRLHE